jgi:hypothetical protein
MATNGPTNHAEQYQPSSAASLAASTTVDQANSNLGKDEVAWFFVEQYYTTLSKTPEKLHVCHPTLQCPFTLLPNEINQVVSCSMESARSLCTARKVNLPTSLLVVRYAIPLTVRSWFGAKYLMH